MCLALIIYVMSKHGVLHKIAYVKKGCNFCLILYSELIFNQKQSVPDTKQWGIKYKNGKPVGHICA